jgi:hypothetical protein
MSGEGSFIDAKRVHERIDVSGEVVHRVAALRPLRVPMAALIWREDMIFRRAQGEHPTEGEPRVGPPVEEDDGFGCWSPCSA